MLREEIKLDGSKRVSESEGSRSQDEKLGKKCPEHSKQTPAPIFQVSIE